MFGKSIFLTFMCLCGADKNIKTAVNEKKKENLLKTT